VQSEAKSAFRYAAPGGALLAIGSVVVAGVLLRGRLQALLASAVTGATHEATHARRMTSDLADDAREQAHRSAERLLHAVGLERRSTSRSILVPATGAALGFIAGAVATYFLAPQLAELLGAKTSEVAEADEDDSVPAAKPTITPGSDGIRSSASAPRPVS
jgi:hypothetical protein